MTAENFFMRGRRAPERGRAQEQVQQATDDADDERAANSGPEALDVKGRNEPTDQFQHQRVDDQREEPEREDVDGQGQDDNERAQVGVDQRQDHGGNDGRLLGVEPDFLKHCINDQQGQRVDRQLH